MNFTAFPQDLGKAKQNRNNLQSYTCMIKNPPPQNPTTLGTSCLLPRMNCIITYKAQAAGVSWTDSFHSSPPSLNFLCNKMGKCSPRPLFNICPAHFPHCPAKTITVKQNRRRTLSYILTYSKRSKT